MVLILTKSPLRRESGHQHAAQLPTAPTVACGKQDCINGVADGHEPSTATIC
jgi:hypothetical protein